MQYLHQCIADYLMITLSGEYFQTVHNRTWLIQQRKVHPVTHNKHKAFYYLPPTQCVNVCVLCVTQVAHYVWNKTDFTAVDPETTDYLMGEFFFFFRFYLCCPLMLGFPAELSCTWGKALEEHSINRPVGSSPYQVPGSSFQWGTRDLVRYCFFPRLPFGACQSGSCTVSWCQCHDVSNMMSVVHSVILLFLDWVLTCCCRVLTLWFITSCALKIVPFCCTSTVGWWYKHTVFVHEKNTFIEFFLSFSQPQLCLNPVICASMWRGTRVWTRLSPKLQKRPSASSRKTLKASSC